MSNVPSTCPTCGMEGWPSHLHPQQHSGSCGSRWGAHGAVSESPACRRIADLVEQVENLRVLHAVAS